MLGRQSWGTPAALGSRPSALPARGLEQRVLCRRVRVGLCPACPLSPAHSPKQRRLRQPATARGAGRELWEASALSHPVYVTSQKPPPPIPVPGEKEALARPQQGFAVDGVRYTHESTHHRGRSEGSWSPGCAEGPGDTGPGDLGRPPSLAAMQAPWPPPRPGQINIYLEKAKVRRKNSSRNSAHSWLGGAAGRP